MLNKISQYDLSPPPNLVLYFGLIFESKDFFTNFTCSIARGVGSKRNISAPDLLPIIISKLISSPTPTQ